MIKIKTKAEVRRELEQQMQQFLKKGGCVENIEQGASGKEMGANINNAIPLNHEKQTRTPLIEEVNNLDARKNSKKASASKTSRPKKRIIYDDFGDPIREVWEE